MSGVEDGGGCGQLETGDQPGGGGSGAALTATVPVQAGEVLSMVLPAPAVRPKAFFARADVSAGNANGDAFYANVPVSASASTGSGSGSISFT